MTRLSAAAALSAAVLLSPGLTAQSTTRSVHVTVTNNDKKPVTDLTAAEFTVKDGGKTCEIVKAEVSSVPMQIAVLVDDNGTGFFRAGLITFVNRLLSRAQFAISSVTGQTQRLTDFTNNTATLEAAVVRLNARPGTNDGGQLLEGIHEYTLQFQKREAPRSVILALTVGGNEQSSRDSKQTLDELQKSGAVLHVVEVTGNTLRPKSEASNPSELLDSNMNLSAVLGDGPKQSGGRHVSVVATNAKLIDGLQQIADELANQYLVTYTLPANQKPSGRLSVEVKRKGTAVSAPAKVPQR